MPLWIVSPLFRLEYAKGFITEINNLIESILPSWPTWLAIQLATHLEPGGVEIEIRTKMSGGLSGCSGGGMQHLGDRPLS